MTPSRAFFTIGDLVRTTGGSPFGPGRKILDRDGAGGRRLRRPALHLDKAHPAIAGDRQPLVKAKPRDLRARLLAGLQKRIFRRNVDLDAVHDEFAHALPSMRRFDEIEPPLDPVQPCFDPIEPAVDASDR